MTKFFPILAAVLFIASQSIAQNAPATPKSITDLSNSLSGLVDGCNARTAELRSADETAAFKRGLDRQLANQRIRNDTELYRMRNGNSQGSSYMLEQMKAQNERDAETSKQMFDKMEEGTKQINACLRSAEENGKSLYSAYKNSAVKNLKIDEATSLMTAWLANVRSVSKQNPSGTDETKAAWQTAKARAELAGL